MAGPFFQGTNESLRSLIEGTAKMGGAYLGHREAQGRKKKDQDFLDYLTGQLNPDIEAPAPEPMPVADLGMGMPDTAAPVTPGAEDITSLIEGRRQGAKQLLSSPESALQIMVEAKKRGVSTDANSLLDFIAKSGQQAEVTEREREKMGKQAELEAQREQARNLRQEALIRSRERMGEESNETRLKTAGITADASRYRTDNPPPRSGSRPLPKDLTKVSLEDLETMQDGFEDDLSAHAEEKPTKGDGYDKADMVRYRIELDDFNNEKMEMRANLRAVQRAIRLKQKAPAGGAPAAPGQGGVGRPTSPAAAPSAGAQGRPRPDAQDQEIAAYLKANGKLVSSETIAITRQRLQQPAAGR